MISMAREWEAAARHGSIDELERLYAAGIANTRR